ncbi:NAD-dependent epimerase/dehydratase family protein [Oleisolibacter albus]|uniref:NAD-dependent epimerase/dehydratase family protein n=1 Tax=Oleisolibacter albus TaxID=2171757 RepID=UPI000DF38D27|nr:NAD-dependent epimerase/dehydratase family protein [Oleisolibacter albus]
MPIFVTGANGFIGQRVVSHPTAQAIGVRAGVRAAAREGGTPLVAAPASNQYPGWELRLDALPWRDLCGCEAVIHCAALAHSSGHTPRDYEEINLQGSIRVAEAAIRAGVKRLVFVSSAKVFGDHSGPSPFGPQSVPAPNGPYAQSKFLAEQALQALAARTGLDLVIVRPPLVHGPGVCANLLRLLRLVERGMPLPLAGVRSRRSLVGVANLADLLLRAALHPRAPGQILTVSDGEDPTVPALVRMLGQALERPARLFAVPEPLLGGIRRLAQPRLDLGPLLDPLQVDIGATRALLDWQPPVPLEQGLDEMARWYRRSVRP